MLLNHPYAQPFRLLSIAANTTAVTHTWESTSNRIYGIDTSTNLPAWTALVTNITATGTNTVFTTNAPSVDYLPVNTYGAFTRSKSSLNSNSVAFLSFTVPLKCSL
jgi:hypothetical protein